MVVGGDGYNLLVPSMTFRKISSLTGYYVPSLPLPSRSLSCISDVFINVYHPFPLPLYLFTTSVTPIYLIRILLGKYFKGVDASAVEVETCKKY